MSRHADLPDGAVGADDGRPMVVLYFADCDPAGWQMPISVGRKLQALEDRCFPELEFEVRRVALTPDQVREYGLPSTPLKETEKRADRWQRGDGRRADRDRRARRAAAGSAAADRPRRDRPVLRLHARPARRAGPATRGSTRRRQIVDRESTASGSPGSAPRPRASSRSCAARSTRSMRRSASTPATSSCPRSSSPRPTSTGEPPCHYSTRVVVRRAMPGAYRLQGVPPEKATRDWAEGPLAPARRCH